MKIETEKNVNAMSTVICNCTCYVMMYTGG